MGDRVRLVVGRAEQLPFPDGSFDALTFTYLLRYVDDPQATLPRAGGGRETRWRGGQPGVPPPPSRFWRSWWWLYTRLILPAGGWLTGGREWFRVGRFLGPNISGHDRTYPLAWTEDAGAGQASRTSVCGSMSLGGGLVMWGTRRSD